MKPTTRYIIYGSTTVFLLILIFKKRKSIMDYIMSTHNKPYIDKLNDDAKPHFIELFAKAQEKGWNFYITSSIRVQTKNSMHQLGIAIDCNLVNIETGKYINMKDNTAEDWLDTGIPQLAEKLGFTWGGRFVNYINMYGKHGDSVHFEFNFGKTYQQLIEIGIKQFGTKQKALENYKNIKFK